MGCVNAEFGKDGKGGNGENDEKEVCFVFYFDVAKDSIIATPTSPNSSGGDWIVACVDVDIGDGG